MGYFFNQLCNFKIKINNNDSNNINDNNKINHQKDSNYVMKYIEKIIIIGHGLARSNILFIMNK